MDMTGERRIPAPRQVVWDALNDTATLKASIPGCESLEKTDDTHMKATAAIKLGPIAARFNGAVTLSDIDPPNSYVISGEGQGGVAGFAKGGAKVFLTDDEGDTLLRYEVNAQVGGKLAQLGARLIDATAKSMAEQFFTKFSGEVQKRVPAGGTTTETASADTVLAAPPTSAPPMSDAPAEDVSPGVAPTPVPPQIVAPPIAIPPARPTPATPAAEAPTPHPQTPPPQVKSPSEPPPSAVGPLALIPREAFGVPLVGWIGIAVFAVIVVIALTSMR